MEIQYGVLSPYFEGILPAPTLRTASTWAGIDGKIFARSMLRVADEYEEYGEWYEPHCDYCQERGDLRELFGHLSCPHCWGEIYEAVQDEKRWQIRHAHEHRDAA